MGDDKKETSGIAESTKEELDILPQGPYVIGIGGCGNNLIDTIALRENSEEVRENIPKERWNQIIAGQAMINSHLAELASSYYFTEVKQQEAGTAAEQYAFEQYGAGYNREQAKNMLLDYLDSDLSWENLWGEDLQPSRVERANSIWLLHSSVGGTGAGATPQFASSLRDSLRHQRKTPIISFPVLNDSPDLRDHCNTIVGISQVSDSVEAVIPMSNKKLRTLPNNELFDIEYNDRNTVYAEENKRIITFLELMGGCLTSETDFGGFIDITDIYKPIEQYYPSDKWMPAPILAPAMKKSTKGNPGDHLEKVISNLFEEGKLIEFDPSTAWGASLIFCGPPDQMENVINKPRYQQVSDLVSEYMDKENGQSTGPSVRTYQVGLSGLDNVWLIAFVANPTIPEIDRAYDTAAQHKNSDTPVGEGLENNWRLIDNLVNVLQSKPQDLID